LADYQKAGTKLDSAPTLRYRAIVPSNSGVFKILKDMETEIYQIFSPVSEKHFSNLISSMSVILQKSIGEKFSPYDVDEDGNGVLHVMLFSLAQ
jgi:hypothetical protein